MIIKCLKEYRLVRTSTDLEAIHQKQKGITNYSNLINRENYLTFLSFII